MDASNAPPSLDGWLIFCNGCKAERTVCRIKEVGLLRDEVYYNYVCAECRSILLTVAAADPA